MKLKWCGTATLILESGGSRLLIDPYMRRLSNDAPVHADEARSADAIFITHPHVDHFADIDEFSEGRIPVYVSETGIKLAKKNGLDITPMRQIAAGDVITEAPFTVRALPAEHCRFDAATILRIVFSPRTWTHVPRCVKLLRDKRRFEIDRRDVLAFHVSDGEKSVIIFGSAGMNNKAEYPVGADLLVYPFQGRRRIDKLLAETLDRLRPKAVTIDHFDDAFPPFTKRGNLSRFAPAVLCHAPNAKYFVPELNEWYEI